jgi:hypothetical protein
MRRYNWFTSCREELICRIVLLCIVDITAPAAPSNLEELLLEYGGLRDRTYYDHGPVFQRLPGYESEMSKNCVSQTYSVGYHLWSAWKKERVQSQFPSSQGSSILGKQLGYVNPQRIVRRSYLTLRMAFG